MKKLLVVLSMGMMFAASASTIYPQLTVWPTGVDLRVWNNTQKDARCSGMINIYTKSGKFKTEFYNSTIYRGMTDYRHYTNFTQQDAYVSGHHSIYCTSY